MSYTFQDALAKLSLIQHDPTPVFLAAFLVGITLALVMFRKGTFQSDVVGNNPETELDKTKNNEREFGGKCRVKFGYSNVFLANFASCWGGGRSMMNVYGQSADFPHLKQNGTLLNFVTRLLSHVSRNLSM
jgi:hypothetical protein